MQLIITTDSHTGVKLGTLHIWRDAYSTNHICAIVHRVDRRHFFNDVTSYSLFDQDWIVYHFKISDLQELLELSTDVLQNFILFNLEDFMNHKVIEQVIDV